jgi:hypothetical protein
MTVKILTPEGGTPNYVVLLALRNEIIGNIIFKNKDDLDNFLQMYKTLQPIGFGQLELNIDTRDDDNG